MVSPGSSSATPSSSTTTCSLTTSSTKPPSSTRSSETHVCPYPSCAKSFSKKYNLKAHLRLHTGEQPFECDRPDCNKKFKWRSSLSSHTVWHSRKDKTSTANPTTTTTSSSSSSSSATTTTTTTLVTTNNNINTNNNTTPSSSNLTACSSRPTANPASTTASSAAANRKRPRTSRPSSAAPRTLPTSTSSVDLTKLGNFNNSRRTCSKPPSKKQKKCGKPSSQPASQQHIVQLAPSHNVFPAPSSPLTDAASFFDYSSATDSPMDSQRMLELDEFSEHVLSLDVRHADGPCLQMQIGLEDVASIMDDADQCGGLFSQYGGATCANLTPLDTRFGPFDLDNLQAFGMNTTVEGL